MKTLKVLLFAAGLTLASVGTVAAQGVVAGTAEKNVQFWEADIPGGNYMVRLDSISTVSTHQYLVQAGVRVWEVNIGDTSSTVARFYYMEPIKPDDKLGPVASAVNKTQDIAERALATSGAEQVFLRVVKDYPTSTHAHTVEFRLDKLSNLKSLYDHLKNAYKSQKGGTFTITGGDQ